MARRRLHAALSLLLLAALALPVAHAHAPGDEPNATEECVACAANASVAGALRSSPQGHVCVPGPSLASAFVPDPLGASAPFVRSSPARAPPSAA